ncbi:TatD family hydrolase [Flavobacteriales bacterium]|jgi:TatD DNase family protein|nr:TatD family hydrolase [Flavobacteriales bacterium]
MNLIDTHTHLFSSQFDDDRHLIVQNAIDKGVSKMLLPNINSQTIDAMHKLCADFPTHCFPMMGLHPCDVKENYLEELQIVKSYLDKGSYVALGEIGIDLYWDKDTLDIQKEAFRQQLIWAKEYDLPVAIHIRESFDEVFEIIEEVNDDHLRGVFHCFTGNEAQAKKAIELGFMLGVGGVVTFKNSGLDKTLKNLDLNHLILETDSPYLAPTPHRGQRNESSFLPLIAQKLAEIYEINVEEVAKVTSHNANTLFKL